MNIKNPKVSIIMRSFNDIDTIWDTLCELNNQTYQDFELWNHDSGSTDGTLEIIRKFNNSRRITINDSADYVPGRVLNRAVDLCSGSILVFLNSDATPTSHQWLEELVAPLLNFSADAVYGRQVARDDCRTLFQKDTERAFGDGQTSAGWVHFFSMANSASHKSTLQTFRFREDIQYSEDIEWSLRLKKAGLTIKYIGEASAAHSHNYTLSQSYKRHFGEGKAELEIFSGREINFSFPRYFLLPLGMEILRDFYWSAKSLSLDGFLHAIPLRVAQKTGRWHGMKQAKESQEAS
jgi:rhamnosyltransferase|tara:strand:- start:1016 stop:1894 length:879 start_codon:yes stop_codon:yes gene_type:complete